MFKGSIVSEDGTATIIVFTLFDDAEIQSLANAVKEKTTALNYLNVFIMRITHDDHLHSPSDPRLILKGCCRSPSCWSRLSFFSGFRSFREWFCLCSQRNRYHLVIGIMSLIGSEMSMVSNNIPIVLLAVWYCLCHTCAKPGWPGEGNLNQRIITALTYVMILLSGCIDHHCRFCLFHFSFLPYHDPWFWNVYQHLERFSPLSLSLFFCSGSEFLPFLEKTKI